MWFVLPFQKMIILSVSLLFSMLIFFAFESIFAASMKQKVLQLEVASLLVFMIF